MSGRAIRLWKSLPTELLPFADATEGLPLGRLLRLSLVQVSVGMAMTLLNGTLNRVMIVEIGVPASAVAAFIALPLLLAPIRALIGFRSDTHKSAFGWRRVPYIWMGTMAQFGGLALVPMALMLMGTDATPSGHLVGIGGTLIAFFLIGVGLNAAQTAGLALACDLAPEERRPRVVAFMYVVLLLAMLVSALIFGAALDDFTPRHLFAAVGGAAMVTVALNLVALWKQESRGSAPVVPEASTNLAEAWRAFDRGGRARRLLVAVALATIGFNMQDVLLEPYGGEVLHLSVGATTMLTAIWAAGSLAGFGLAAHRMKAGADPHLLAALGVMLGIPAFVAVAFSGALDTPMLFRAGAFGIGLGGGITSVSLLSAATRLAEDGRFGFAIGAWGTVQASAAGLSTAVGGVIRDWLHQADRLAGYTIVYNIEIAALFAALVALGPLASHARGARRGLMLGEFPA